MRSPEIERLFRRVRIVVYATLAVHLLLLAFCAFLASQLVPALAGKYMIYQPWTSGMLAATILFALLIRSIAIAFSVNDLTAANVLDEHHALKNRLTTYVQYRDSQNPFVEALSHETSHQLGDVKVTRAAEMQRLLIPTAALALVLLTSLLVLPFLPVPARIQARKEERRQVQEQINELKKIVKQQEPRAGVDLKKMLRDMETQLKELERPDIDKVEALKKLNRLEQQRSDLARELNQKAKQDLQNAMQNAAGRNGKNPGQPFDQASNEDLDRLARQLEDAMGANEKTGGSELQEELRSRMQNLSKEDAEKLKKAIEEYQSKQTEREKQLAELKDAIEKSRAGMGSGSGKAKIVTDSRLKDRDIEKGKGGVEDGPGTTNQDVGPQNFNTHKKNAGEYMEDRTRAGYEQLYEGQREKAGSDPLFLENQWNKEGESRYMRVRTFGLPSESTAGPAGNISSQPDTTESEIRKERIPAAYQKIVSDYFRGIEE